MLNLAIHNIERVTLGTTNELSSNGRRFATRNLTVTYENVPGEIRTQTIELYAADASSLSFEMPEEVTA